MLRRSGRGPALPRSNTWVIPALASPSSGASPLPADGTGAGLADVEPARDVDLHEVELEERVARDRLDHAADAAGHHDRAGQCADRRVICHLGRGRANAEFVILGPGER